jgi:hypothetical protein
MNHIVNLPTKVKLEPNRLKAFNEGREVFTADGICKKDGTFDRFTDTNQCCCCFDREDLEQQNLFYKLKAELSAMRRFVIPASLVVTYDGRFGNKPSLYVQLTVDTQTSELFGLEDQDIPI